MGVPLPWQEIIMCNVAAKGVDVVIEAVCATNERRRALSLYTERQLAALRKHGYPWWALPRGVAGRAGDLMLFGPDAMNPHGVYLRNRVCQLDGVEIDGCEYSDLDYDGVCIHCHAPIDEADQWVT
jgi:hypothetical protein